MILEGLMLWQSNLSHKYQFFSTVVEQISQSTRIDNCGRLLGELPHSAARQIIIKKD